MASEQFSLCWDNFHKNLSSGMSSLLETEDLVDVTIAVEGRYVKAHKMILSLCSPYFRELFKVNPCKHPIVVLKDVSFEAMSDLLQFMYQGEVQVSQENLSSFIKTAEALQIKGLTGDGSAVHEADLEPVETNEVVTMKPSSSRLKHKAQPSTGMPSAKKTKTSSNANITNVISTSSITSAKCKLSNSNDMEDETVLVPITREPAPRSSLKKEELTAFKMEPYEQVQQTMSVDDDDDDEDDLNDTNYTDDHLDDKNNEENVEEYPMLGEEPKPGTSSEATAAGEGQDAIYWVTRRGTLAILYEENLFQINKKVDNTSWWQCFEYRKLKCRCRLTTTSAGLVTRSKIGHNHNLDRDKIRKKLQRMRLFH